MSSSKNSYSKKEIHSKLLDIAAKYTNPESEDYLKSSLFGYLTESMSMMIRDSSLHKAMLYRESFLNTAVMPKSIYNWAKMFNINISKATPAYADIEIIIDSSDLASLISKKTLSSYSKDYGITDKTFLNKNVFILDRDNPIIVNEYTFTLERSIMVYNSNSDSTDESQSYTAQYITTEPVTTSFQSIKTPVLSIFPRGNSYVIQARAYQYKTVTFTKHIPNNSILNTKTHVYNFDGQFAGVAVSYVRGSDSEKNIEVRYSNINNNETGVFCYYNLNNDSELQITFSNNEDAFLPKSNDVLITKIYITEGSGVPSYFNDYVNYVMSDDDFKQHPITVRFNPTDIIGGKDMPTVDKIRDTIINEISSRNVIITESDLNNYFSILTALLESINSGKVTFVKKRDDVMRRLFSAYVLLRDGLDDNGEIAESNFVSRCVPTNTIDIDFPVSRNVSRPFGTIARRKTDDINSYVYAPTTEGLDDYYVIPFYMYISLSPIKKIKYIYNLADNETTSSFTKIGLSNNNAGYYMLPNNIHLKRDMCGRQADDKYTVDFKFTTNFDMAMYCKNIDSNGYLVMMKDNNTIGRVDLTATNNSIKTSKQESATGKLFDTTISVTVDVAPTEFDFSNGSTQYIQLMSNDSTKISIPEEVVFGLVVDKLNVNGIGVGFEVRGDEKQSLFQNLDSMLFSDIILNVDNEAESEQVVKTDNGYSTEFNKVIRSITVKDVPVVHGSYFDNDAASKKDKFINQLFTYIRVLKENIDKLETNTFFDIKFYNTYGAAQIYDSLKTNIDLEMDVYLANGYKNDENIKTNIKSYIRRIVDESNKTGAIRCSSIVSLTDSNFNEYIDHIDFKGLNNSFNQYIGKLDVDESKHVLEWLNISPKSLDTLIKFK